MNTKNLELSYLKLQSLACILHREIGQCDRAIEEMSLIPTKFPHMKEDCQRVAESYMARRKEAQEILDSVHEGLNPR